MEQKTGLHNTFHSFQNGKVARKLVEEGRQSSSSDGLPQRREVDNSRPVLRVAATAGSGFAYPSVGGGFSPVIQNGAEHSQDNRKASFNRIAKAV